MGDGHESELQPESEEELMTLEESAEHTPGPWTLETVRTQVGICHKIGPFPWKDGRANHACVYVDYPGTGAVEAELLANARLIAAAPNLLAALKAAREELRLIRMKDTDAVYNPCLRIQMDIAIAKATQP